MTLLPRLTYFSAIIFNLEAILVEYPEFETDEFFEMTDKIQDIVNNENFDRWRELFGFVQTCSHEVEAIEICINHVKSINFETILTNDEYVFDGLRDEVAKREFISSKFQILFCFIS